MAKEQNGDILTQEAVDDGSPRVYELGFHLDSELPTEEVKKSYGAVRETIAEKGTIIAEGEPVSIPLAYTISRQETSGRRDFNSAFFAWIVYETSAESHADVISAAGANKHIVRFIDLTTTKDAARHAEEIRDIALKISEKADDSESSAGTELDAAIDSAIPAQTEAI